MRPILQATGSIDYMKKLEAPGSLLGDVDVNLSTSSLPVGFDSIHECEYIRADQPDLVIVGARPSVGKSALLCQMAYNLSAARNVHLFSLEMDKRQIKGRLMALEGGKPIRELRFEDTARLNVIAGVVNLHKLFLDDTNGLDVNSLYSRAVDRAKLARPAAIFVDYLQIVGTPNPGRSKAEEVDLVARRLKELALELKCPVVAAAQMNRNFEGRLAAARKKEDVLPMMSDLADSAGIEKWADVVMFLHRKFVNGVVNREKVALTVCKNRHGQIRDLNLHFEGPILKFFDNGIEGTDTI